MKKLLVVMLAMAIAISFGSMAMAKNGLSVELGLAYNPNGADMGEIIMKDGEEGQENGLFGDVVMSENSFLAVKKSKHPLGVNLIKSATDDGAMSGINTTLRVRYDFLDAFFVRLGFVYDQQIAGGDDSFKLTDNATALGLAAYSQGVNATASSDWGAALAGGKITQKWTYGYWAIPVTVGINVPVTEKFNLYAGIGLTYYSGYWQLEGKFPQGYMIGDYNGDHNPTATSADLDLAVAGKEKLKFEASGIGINWTVGASVVVYQDISLFIEIDTTMGADMSDSEKLKTNQGKVAFSSDNLYYPVSLSTQLIRFGASYKLPLEI